jgi:flagellar biosynthesis/type III secretory pathway M-ring protein FliF/YscJ
MPELSIDTIAIVLVVVIGLFVVVRGLAMPRTFRKREAQREKRRKESITQRPAEGKEQPEEKD